MPEGLLRARPPKGARPPPEPLSKAPKTKRDAQGVLDHVLPRLERFAQAVLPSHVEWRLLQRYESGDVFEDPRRPWWDSRTRRAYDDDTPDWHARVSPNIVRSTKEVILGDFARSRTVIEVHPASDELADALAAECGRKLAFWFRRSGNLWKLRRQVASDCFDSGGGWLKVSFDPHAGGSYDFGDEQPVYEGDLVFSSPDPFDMFWDTGAPDIDGCAWIAERQYLTPDQVAALRPDVAHLIPSRGTAGTVLRDIDMERAGQHDRARLDVDNRLVFLQYFEAPTRERPDGRFIQIVEDVPIHEGDLPYHRATANPRTGKGGVVYPYSFAPWRRVGRRFFGDGARDLLGLQKEVAKLTSRNLDHEHMAALGFFVLFGTTLDDHPITAEPGCVYDGLELGEQDIQFRQVQHAGSSFWYTHDRLLAHMHENSAVNEISRGQPVVGGSGTASEGIMLKDADNSRRGVMATAINEAETAIVRVALRLAQAYMTVPRLLQVVGDDDYAETLMFKGSDLRGFQDLDIIDGMGDLPASRVARIQSVGDLMQRQLMDRDEAREVINLPRASATYTFERQKIANFRRDCASILIDGRDVQIEPRKDHLLALRVGLRFMESAIFRGAPISHKARFHAWMDAHEQAQMVELAQGVLGAAGELGAGLPLANEAAGAAAGGPASNVRGLPSPLPGGPGRSPRQGGIQRAALNVVSGGQAA